MAPPGDVRIGRFGRVRLAGAAAVFVAGVADLLGLWAPANVRRRPLVAPLEIAVGILRTGCMNLRTNYVVFLT